MYTYSTAIYNMYYGSAQPSYTYDAVQLCYYLTTIIVAVLQ